MSNYVRNFCFKDYYSQTTIPQLIANNMSGCFFFLNNGVEIVFWKPTLILRRHLIVSLTRNYTMNFKAVVFLAVT